MRPRAVTEGSAHPHERYPPRPNFGAATPTRHAVSLAQPACCHRGGWRDLPRWHDRCGHLLRRGQA
eukprot:scaffold72424_cov71-Phaeocystis_antarctica.AAC.1